VSKKNALITGASAGIGASLSEFLAEMGFHVILVARREERLQKIRNEIINNGGLCTIIPADLTNEAERKRVYKETVDAVGCIDILVNNAGFGWYGYYQDMSWRLADELVSINIVAVMHLTSLFLPGMINRGIGHIVNIGSIAGGLPNQGITVYSGSKAFLDAFTTGLYRETRGSGVTVSIMRLGPIETEFFDKARSLENGYSVPAERFAISTDHVNKAFLRMLKRPRRVMYVPGWLWISQFVEILFGAVIDRLGPLLLKRKKRKTENKSS
jgi:uncharacterized protein